MSYQHLRVMLGEPVSAIVLARPETRNAMSCEMGEELERAVAEANAQDSLRVLLLRGEGQGFSSGGDFQMLEQRALATEAENRIAMRRFYASFLSIRRVRVPTIAVVQGAAVGAGLCLALACDLRIASNTAKLAASFGRVGLHPGMGATWLLPRIVGPSKAAQLLFTGETLSAEEAHRIGLVNELADPERLLEHAHGVADRIAQGAPLAIALTKQTLERDTASTLDAALDAEAEAQAKSFASADLREALRAFAEKRAPQFRGE
jgi:enoyl-CoA hydratase/carnithine racemase